MGRGKEKKWTVMMRLRYWGLPLGNQGKGMVSTANVAIWKLIVGLEEMWTELYAPKSIVCYLCREEDGRLTIGRSGTW